MRKLVFNAEFCTGCRACELACSFHCEGVFQPSKSRIRVVKIDEDGIDVPVGCEHCENAVCMLICPVKAITRDSNTGAICLNNDICIGCKQCLSVCPFGAIHFDPQKRSYNKCDLCKGDPECVKWCFTGGVKYCNPNELLKAKRISRAKKSAEASTQIRKYSSAGRG
jgi:Fe-S-cluster-containing hydrogenase component 2